MYRGHRSKRIDNKFNTKLISTRIEYRFTWTGVRFSGVAVIRLIVQSFVYFFYAYKSYIYSKTTIALQVLSLPCSRTMCTYPLDRSNDLPTGRCAPRKNTVCRLVAAKFRCRRRSSRDLAVPGVHTGRRLWSRPTWPETYRHLNRTWARNSRPPGYCVRKTRPSRRLSSRSPPRETWADTASASSPLDPTLCNTKKHVVKSRNFIQGP